jgi:orotate phosphoribosyltransferase
MEKYKEDFIDFMVKCNVLTFGDFTTKSGRKTPFFINTGNYRYGDQLEKLGEFYRRAMNANRLLYCSKTVLFGPAYKGIPLVIATAIAINSINKVSMPYCFNRKEAKDHGEGGSLIGYRPIAGDDIIIVEDVITAGTSVSESVALFAREAPEAKIICVVVSVDRMEKGTGDESALQEISEKYGIKVFSIVNLDDIVFHLHNREIDGKVIIDDAMKNRIDAYRAQYGIRK